MHGDWLANKIRNQSPLRRSQKGCAPPHGARSGLRTHPDGRIYIELINGPFLFREKGTSAEYNAGLELAIKRGWLELQESGIC